ncbi:MAG: sigma-54-dependent Fis family transcriptional regulator [Deltaproteobacteria bacterium]|nr:sigma-54-dependent Fis family transcriptional regulator [Deltaproteobacteria bacterium]
MYTRVLIIDDDEATRQFLTRHVASRACEAVEAHTAEAGLAKLDGTIDAVFLDLSLPDSDGLVVLEAIRKREPNAVVLLMSDHSTVKVAVAAMKEGAFHYAAKPLDLEDMADDVNRTIELATLRRELRELRARQTEPYSFARLIGRSKPIESVRALLGKLARSPSSTVLLTGESGTGKDLAAKVLHYNSERSGRPFMNVTCSALPEALLESQLFGHERGAFTDAKERKLGLFEIANGGTVFLDEIGELPVTLQVKLLRFLEEKTFMRVGGSRDVQVDVRIVAATNRNLEDAVRRGAFREDLYFRLRVFPVVLPPLRTRDEDVPILVAFFLDHYNADAGRSIRGVSPAALALLEQYPWPGNVRELKNAVERAVLLTEGDVLQPDDFLVLTTPMRATETFRLPASGVNLEELERSFMIQALERTQGNQVQAGRLLGINRDQVRYRVEKYSLDLAHFGRAAQDD